MPPSGRSSHLDRRTFMKLSAAGMAAFLAGPLRGLPGRTDGETSPLTPVYWVNEIPDDPYAFPDNPNYHGGLEALLALLGWSGLKFYNTPSPTLLGGPEGLIAPDDIVLIKVNAQWKYRGATNTDLVRGLIQRLLDFPGGFRGEVVIFENGQGRGSLACDNTANYSDDSVRANANDERQSFLYLVESVFRDSRVSARLFDRLKRDFISQDDHITDGYRIWENVSYPCFTTAGGRRVELKEGIWNGSAHERKLKLINVPVLKHHDTGGSEITASLKHVYGILSMSDGQSDERHYRNLGSVCGKMFVSVRTPVLNILDCIWASHKSITGYPASTTFRANQLLASQDPVALDVCGAKHVLYPIDNNDRHHPDFPGIDAWLVQARDMINGRGGLRQAEPLVGVDNVTRDEAKINLVRDSAARYIREGPLRPEEPEPALKIKKGSKPR